MTQSVSKGNMKLVKIIISPMEHTMQFQEANSTRGLWLVGLVCYWTKGMIVFCICKPYRNYQGTFILVDLLRKVMINLRCVNYCFEALHHILLKAIWKNLIALITMRVEPGT